ncbi:MAG: hypothetical protein M0C28_33600 [Candidatus Moduliflexus flocculans]|nr:hypothetical protein [Candidatus Moduliflexus flocculans]
MHEFFWAWFSPEYDEDRDGLPQWKHILQTGFEDNPLFDAWHAWSLGVDITQVHSPALEAMLYHEASCLVKMAELLERNDTLALLQEQAAKLRSSIEIHVGGADGVVSLPRPRDRFEPGRQGAGQTARFGDDRLRS